MNKLFEFSDLRQKDRQFPHGQRARSRKKRMARTARQRNYSGEKRQKAARQRQESAHKVY